MDAEQIDRCTVVSVSDITKTTNSEQAVFAAFLPFVDCMDDYVWTYYLQLLYRLKCKKPKNGVTAFKLVEPGCLSLK